MELWKGIATFTKPDDLSNVLNMTKGDEFIVIAKKSENWWGAINRSTHEFGYIPAKYLQFINVADSEEANDLLRYTEKSSNLQISSSPKSLTEIHPLSPEIPPPDYDLEEDSNQLDDDDFFTPDYDLRVRRVSQPLLRQPMREELNREFKFNLKHGRAMLRKTELGKEIERRAVLRYHREREAAREAQRTSLEVKLDERAKKIYQQEAEEREAMEEEARKTEFERAHDKIRKKSSSEST